jgi:hypothetical protein
MRNTTPGNASARVFTRVTATDQKVPTGAWLEGMEYGTDPAIPIRCLVVKLAILLILKDDVSAIWIGVAQWVAESVGVSVPALRLACS